MIALKLNYISSVVLSIHFLDLKLDTFWVLLRISIITFTIRLEYLMSQVEITLKICRCEREKEKEREREREREREASLIRGRGPDFSPIKTLVSCWQESTCGPQSFQLTTKSSVCAFLLQRVRTPSAILLAVQ